MATPSIANVTSPPGPLRIARKVVAAVEHGTVDLPLAQLFRGSELAIYPEVLRQDLFQLRWQGSSAVFQARGYVGLIPLNDHLAIDVRPRVPLSNLEYILAASGEAPIEVASHVRRYREFGGQATSLVDFLANGLLHAVDPIKLHGLHRAYDEDRQSTSIPRGRILLGPSVSTHLARGQAHLVVSSRYVQTIDTAPNRCIRVAVRLLCADYRSRKSRTVAQRRTVASLNQVDHMLAGVSLESATSFLMHPLVRSPEHLPETRHYYLRAVYLARLIVSRLSVSFGSPGGPVELNTLLIKMDDVFEEYIRLLLRRQLVGAHGASQVLDGNRRPPTGGAQPLFEDTDRPQATPDVVLVPHAGQGASVPVEVKYKPQLGRDDLNQAIAYGACFGAGRVLVVSPALDGAAAGLSTVGLIGGIRVLRYLFNLAASDISEEEAAFARATQAVLSNG